MQAAARRPSENPMRPSKWLIYLTHASLSWLIQIEKSKKLGSRHIVERVERPGGAVSSNSVRWRARSIPRPHGAVQDWRQLARHQLLVHGRLRGSRLLLGGDCDPARGTQGPLQGPHHHTAWQPRIPTDHTSVRLLWRVPAQVWQRQCVEIFHRSIRLSTTNRLGRFSSLLRLFVVVALTDSMT